MLKDDTVRKLLPMLNTKKNRDALMVYVSDRISYFYTQLEQCKTAEEMHKIQGAIRELRRFETLQDEVTQRAKEI